MLKKKKVKEYDKNILKPILQVSICTGETLAGFKNIETSQFDAVMLIKNDKDLKRFLDMYGITDIKKEY